MTMLATRKFQLVQIGSGKMPPLDVITDMTYATRFVSSETEAGGQHDYYATRWSNVGIGTVKYSGLYPICETPQGVPDGLYIRNETDRISVARSVWTPFLFFSNTYVPSQQRGFPASEAGKYLWAYGKITNFANASSILDHAKQRSTLSRASVQRAVPMDLQATLRTPLVPITYSRWRYGASLAMTVERKTLSDDLEISNAESPGLWFAPSDIPWVGENAQRFWPRNLYGDNFNTGSVEFDPARWECPYLTLRNPSSEMVNVNGNTQPRTRVVMTGDAYFTIRNALGTFVYSYGRPQSSAIYADSWTGVVMERDVNGVVAPVLGAGWMPQLTWPDNIVTCIDGVVSIGNVEAWIN